ncbi:hypothetical protein DT076_13950 [Desertihabitans brevis]|uniref:4-hydroxythreonine-4-phosphate dehydrogenase n=1 Tax=Desertihabitans brevis TaxID=2268447 RepID=A0A367YVF4_9ACTN|nr:four-carbon acid sugar kinase family protein [Desertihabitans brevis]RCK69002.1 hypothetical protein DT076_13950 [Desertihabitans brevis]
MAPQPGSLSVLADDLSGAVESAALLGPGTPVHLDPPARADHAPQQVLDTDTRRLDPSAAADRLERAWASLGPGRVFVKIDSLLRGPVPALVSVAARHGTVLLCPALPTEGRAVVDGVLLCSGRPLAATTAWQLEPTPPPATVAELFPDHPVQHVPTAALRDGGLAETVRSTRDRVLVCDASTPADLAALGRVLDEHPHLVGVGSAQLLAGWRPPPRAAPAPDRPAGPTRPVLVLVGSASAEAREQTRQLLRRPDVAEVPAPLRGARLDATRLAAELARARGRAATTVLTLPALADPAPGTSLDPDRLAADLGAVVAEAVRDRPDDLVLIGGTTARATLGALGVDLLRVRGGIHPGAVATTDRSGRVVVTRPGSHGPPTSLLDILDWLEGHPR